LVDRKWKIEARPAFGLAGAQWIAKKRAILIAIGDKTGAIFAGRWIACN
jgi:hypothetical protein